MPWPSWMPQSMGVSSEEMTKEEYNYLLPVPEMKKHLYRRGEHYLFIGDRDDKYDRDRRLAGLYW